MKNWKHYLFEFILLFAAVSLGFLTDNWREVRSEKKQEKQYLESLSKDLTLDVLRYKSMKAHLESRVVELDTIMNHLSNDNAKISSTQLHMEMFKAAILFSPDGFTSANVTMKQLENDGFRVITNRAVVDSLVAYYTQSVNRINTHYKIMIDEKQVLTHTMEEIFDFKIFDEYWNPLAQYEFHTPTSSPRLNPKDSKKLLILLNQLQDQKWRTLRTINHIDRNSKQATRYIDFFHNELSK